VIYRGKKRELTNLRQEERDREKKNKEQNEQN